MKKREWRQRWIATDCALTREHERVERSIAAYARLTQVLIGVEEERDKAKAEVDTLKQIVGEGGSARPTPDRNAYGEDDPPMCAHGTRESQGWCAQCEAGLPAPTPEDDREEGLLQAEDHITATMRERGCTFPEAVERLGAEMTERIRAKNALPGSGFSPAERAYIAEINRLRAALAEKRR